MFKKLDKMLERYDNLNELVGDPSVIANMDQWKKYTKELADMSETVEKYSEYKKISQEISDLERDVNTETDKEMKDLMQEEIYSCKEKLEKIADELRIVVAERPRRR